LQEAIAALASEILSMRNLQGPLRVEWHNESSVSAEESSALQAEFSTQIGNVRGLLSGDPSAPSLRVILRETATHLVVIARIPSADGEQIRLVQVSREAFSAQDVPQTTPSLQKQLLWKQREPILDALEHSAGGTAILLVLGRETLWAYAPVQTQIELRAVARIPGPIRPSRALVGSIHFAKAEDAHFLLELPGKVCSGSLSEKISVECPSTKTSTPPTQALAIVAKLLAPCDYGAWTLSSDDGDWSKRDRLFLNDTRSASPERTVALEAPGPVLALSSAPDSASSIAVIWNLSTGEYEVYRFTLACHN
jgi:hypothetical protein